MVDAFSVVVLLRGSISKNLGIIVYNNDVRFATVVEQVGGYFLPWSFWQRSCYHGLCVVFSVFAAVWACCGHLFYLFANTRPPKWLHGFYCDICESLGDLRGFYPTCPNEEMKE